ncbi:Hsp33 family molecular chaperone HslO [Amaricoccus sp.]|uniref:Hsp33 family molecular chaperone HslO n=1 Tax=Amaricoccus sp. TaxID=1872485 RepID=UPI001B4D3FD9|nr:Hsp33 family molecular chaperone HslO [Amaricoccus sp.]MBP7240674.1 Hsp33 family molecular chaperone HslO [Amaricoccus sp.]
MSLAGQIAWDDTILPFQLDRADVRGRVARLDSTLETILSQHDYPGPVAAMIAEAVLLTALIGQAIKRRWRLSLQIRGRGPVRLIATDYFGPEAEGEPARMRAYAGFDAGAVAAHTGAPFDLVEGGVFAILIDQGPGAAPYQGMTPVAGTSLASCAETYFAQSEQLPTSFALAMGEASAPGQPARWRSGGIMLQHMPKAPPRPDTEPAGPEGLMTAADLVDGADADDWNRAVTLMSTVEATELIGPHVGPDQVLLRLFHEEDPRVFTPQPVRFGCTCGPEKVVRSLSIYSPEEIATMTTEDGRVTADCQFCGAHYEFDPAELGIRPET